MQSGPSSCRRRASPWSACSRSSWVVLEAPRVSAGAAAEPRSGLDDALPPVARIATCVLPLLALLFHLSTAHRYGVFRDELYYVACGAHLDFGYVDHPPFVALVARLAQALFGTSLLGLRLLPALAGAATAWTAARLARELGGGPYAQSLAAICVSLGGNALFSFQVLSMNAFDHLFWALGWW